MCPADLGKQNPITSPILAPIREPERMLLKPIPTNAPKAAPTSKPARDPSNRICVEGDSRINLYYYPKTKTNMFVITRSLGKFSSDRRLSDSDMPPAKAQRRQVTGPSLSSRANTRDLGKISLFVRNDNALPLRPWRLCGRYSEFRLRLFAGGEPLFPSAVWGKACLTIK